VRFGSVPRAPNYPPLTELEVRRLTELAEHGPTRHLPSETRGRLALYKLIDETPEGWSITALGSEALNIVPQPVRREGDAQRLSERSPQGRRRYGKKPRNTSWI
jgi:hypothetical protein